MQSGTTSIPKTDRSRAGQNVISAPLFFVKYKSCLASDLKTVGNWNEIGYATPLEMIYLALMLME